MSPDDIIKKQGWNEESLISLFWQYLEITAQVDHFTSFLQQKADEENEENEE